jgi:hypothetical protein
MDNLKTLISVKMLKCLNVKTTERGVSIYFALIIMFILLAIALGISLIIVSQMKMIRGMGDSVKALYGADTGIERALYEKRVNDQNWSGSDTVGEANYNVTYFEDLETGTTGWRSAGTFKGVKRAIEIIPAPESPSLPPDYYLDCLGNCGTADCDSTGRYCDDSIGCSKATDNCTGSGGYCPTTSGEGVLDNSRWVSGTCSCKPSGVLCLECEGNQCVDSTSCFFSPPECGYQCEAS